MALRQSSRAEKTTLRAIRLSVFFLAFSMLLISGCKKKQPPPVPTQAEAPPITQPAPAATAQPAPPSSTTPTAAESAAHPGSTPTAKPKPKPRRTQAKVKKPESTTTSNGNHGTPIATAEAPKPEATVPTAPATTDSPATNHTVIREGGVGEAAGSLSTGISDSEEVRRRQETERLLYDTDKNVKSLTRPLTDDDRAILDQIRNYVAQSRSATTDGDLVRANNLAQKAHLLSAELVKR